MPVRRGCRRWIDGAEADGIVGELHQEVVLLRVRVID